MDQETKAQRGYLSKIMEIVSGQEKGIREAQVKLKPYKTIINGTCERNLVVG